MADLFTPANPDEALPPLSELLAIANVSAEDVETAAAAYRQLSAGDEFENILDAPEALNDGTG